MSRLRLRSALGAATQPVLQRAREVIATEARALDALSQRIDERFERAARLILACRGHLVVCGMGKSGFVAQKLSATFASTGTPSFYLHPAEALHGDLGRVRRDDVVLVLSNSGRTEEVVRLLGPLREIGVTILAVTGDARSPLAEEADLVLDIGPVREACPLGLAPTASTTAMLVLGDALAMCVAGERGLSRDTFARFHPGGTLGRALMRVEAIMRRGERMPLVESGSPLRRAIEVMTRTPGRPGAAVVVDHSGNLAGIFTDGDLRRLVERAGDSLDLTRPVDYLMATDPLTVRARALVGEAMRLLRERAVDQLVVVDDGGRPVGLLDVQDLLAARAV